MSILYFVHEAYCSCGSNLPSGCYFVPQSSQVQKAQTAGDPPQIYLTSVSDPGSLTPLIPLAPVANPGPSGDCGVTPPQSHQVFVVIKPPAAKEPSLPSEEELLEMVGLENKRVEEVRPDF